jgi:hypothetical protein
MYCTSNPYPDTTPDYEPSEKVRAKNREQG